MDYEFQAQWMPVQGNLPSTGTRCIVTDGDTIVVGTYAGPVWILDGIGKDNKYEVIGWMPAPRPMKKIVPHEENLEKN